MNSIEYEVLVFLLLLGLEIATSNQANLKEFDKDIIKIEANFLK